MSQAWQSAVETHKARYREQIIDAAIELIADDGVTKTSMAKLAQHAGVGRATLYKYFPDVESALLAHVGREIDVCEARLDEVIAEHEDPLEQLRACVRALLDYFASRQHRVGWASLDKADLSAKAMATLREEMTRLHKAIIATLRDGIAAGRMRKELDSQRHGKLVFKMVASMQEDITVGALSADEAMDTIWLLLSHGVLHQGR
ncbi:TetR/AcrR family transcriptional regulator [Amycolatopsis sp. CA-230715]|uniref:TetR/AcrR family transcriptional regulator n=1 Tax=Amycolatopsis sp. CA-230715 TaxID=2745196 RepID=UPI001C0320CE|nr:TetR family transcriptional regulator [Amycolatopsis sp. CA-230715]QWF82469.1 Fatty acid metabolism regulator protein [Amycolatopsis sp. CA-230715]